MSRVLPILFNTDMVRAILDDRKTATRRVIKGYIPNDAMFGYTMFTPKGYIFCRGTFANEHGEKFFKLPYQKGDILYVRETWSTHYTAYSNGKLVYCYKADGINLKAGCLSGEWNRWYPSIHMPKEAARIWLKVTDVRVERLHDMTLDDFLSEGVVIRPEAFNDPENAYMQARSEFARIWDSTIRKSQTNLNPWIWVIEFERCEKPESEG